jgi:hypothetical protein
MLDLFFSDNATWFSVPALVGTALFLLRLVLMFIGHADLGIDVDGGDAMHADHGDSTDAFKVLSIQTVAAFAMGFGWGGLGVLKGSEWSSWLALPVGLACGLGMVWLLAILLKAAYDLQTSGNINLNDTVGADGTVYVTVPGDGHGKGQVQLVLKNRQRMYNAVTQGPPLSSHTRVRVVGVNDDNTVTVEAV